MSTLSDYKNINTVVLNTPNRKEVFLVDHETEFRKADLYFKNSKFIKSFNSEELVACTENKSINSFLKASILAYKNKMGLKISPFDIYNVVLSGLHLYVSNILTYEDKCQLVRNIESEIKLTTDNELNEKNLYEMLSILENEICGELGCLYHIDFGNTTIENIATKIRLTASQTVFHGGYNISPGGCIKFIDILETEEWDKLEQFINVVRFLFPDLREWCEELQEFFETGFNDFIEIETVDEIECLNGQITKLFPVLFDSTGNFTMSTFTDVALDEIPFTSPNIPFWHKEKQYDMFLSDTCVKIDPKNLSVEPVYSIFIVEEN